MRIAYADPPYPGQSKKHYGDHADYAGEVDHLYLSRALRDYDGWILHTSSPAAFYVQGMLARTGEWPMDEATFTGGTYRVCVWAKTFAAFKANVPLAYAWEPVLIKPCRKQIISGDDVSRDWIAEPITMRRGLVGVKPDRVVKWALRAAGVLPDDDVIDLFPGSGAVQRAWESYRSQGVLT